MLILFYESYTKTALSTGKCPVGDNNNHVTLTKTFIFVHPPTAVGKRVKDEVDAVGELGFIS